MPHCTISSCKNSRKFVGREKGNIFLHRASFTDVLGEDEIADSQGSQPISLPSSGEVQNQPEREPQMMMEEVTRPIRGAGQRGEFRSVEEIDPKYRDVFTYPYFNLIQSRVIDDALYSDNSMVVCAPTGSGKTVVFEMAIVQLLMELENKNFNEDFKIIYMAPVKALCTERLTEWYSKFTKLGLMCIEVTGDTDVEFSQLKPYRIIITTPEKWDMLTRRWRDHKGLVETIKLFLIDEVHILNDETRGPVLEAVVSRMKTIESSGQSVHRIEQLQKQYQENSCVNVTSKDAPRIRFVAVSATINNPEDVAAWLGTKDRPAVYYKFGDECRPVKLQRVVQGYPCPEGTSIFKFDIILNYKLWPVIQKYHDGKPTLIFCNTRKSVTLTAEALSRELTISFTPEQKAKLTALASTIKTKKLQALVLSGVGCHHAGLLFEERVNIENAFRNRDLPILITTTTLAMGVNLPAHLVIIKNTQHYVNGAYQEYSISTVLQMVGRAGRPQFDTEATAVIMTRLADKPRYQALVGGSEPLQSFLHKRLPENLNSEAALGTVTDVAQCVQWLRSTFLYVRAARDPKWYLGLPPNAPPYQISKKVEELCVTAMNGLASSGLITMDEASCIESTEAGRLMSVFYLDLQTMKQIIKIEGTETLERLLWIICETHELSDMHLRVDERRCLNALNRNNTTATIRFPMKGKIGTRQMKLNCVIQAILGCLPISDPSINQEAMKIMRIADRICKCLVAYLTRPELVSSQPKFYSAVLNSLILAKCVSAHLWENSPYVSRQLKGIGPTFSTLLATAGKTNFMLLEESHPRDLERIMNKGPPSGNVIRKQVSLLPKYQLTTMPIDKKKVSIQLSLLNKELLAENLGNLTAGDRHKSYIVVGDSENYLLLLTAFQEKDLISIYDGTITYEITRKHSFEHKILIHCISSNFVGLDVQEEYTFNNIEPLCTHSVANITNLVEEPTKEKSTLKQTSITDIYKERKRKCNETDVTQSKEKKKRENALIAKFRNLKESFGFKSKKLMQELNYTTEESNRILTEITTSTVLNNENNSHVQFPNDGSGLCMENNKNQSSSLAHYITDSVDTENPEMHIKKMDDDDIMADECVDSILKDIENEISKTRDAQDLTHRKTIINSPSQSISNERVPPRQRKYQTNPTRSLLNNNIHINNISSQVCRQLCSKAQDKRLKRSKNTKSNFNFIDALEKKNDSSNEDEQTSKGNGFSETIRKHVEKFLLNSKTASNQTNTSLFNLLDDKNEKQTPNYCQTSVSKPVTNEDGFISSSKKTERSIENGIENIGKDDRNEKQTPKYCQSSVNKTVTNEDGFISSSEKTERSVENGKENNGKDLIDNIRDSKDKEFQLLDNCKQSTTQSYDEIDDLVNLPDYGRSKDARNNNLETEMTVMICDLHSQNQKLPLSQTDSSNNTNKKCVLVDDNNKTATRLKDTVCKFKKVNTINKANEHRYSSDSKVTQSTDNNLNAHVNKMNSRISNQRNHFDSVFGMDDHIINVMTPVTKSLINGNNTEASVQRMQTISEIETEKPADNLVQRVLVPDKNPKYMLNKNNDLEKGYINRYSFTATKVDVSSRNTKDLQIQYIRKLKVGLDIMEIVSKRKSQANNVDHNVRDTHNFPDSNISSYLNINNKTKLIENPYNDCKVMDTGCKPKILTNNHNLNNSYDNYSSIVYNQVDHNIASAIDYDRTCESPKNSKNKSLYMSTITDTDKSPSSQSIHYENKPGKKDKLMVNTEKEDSDTKTDDFKCKTNDIDKDTEKYWIKNNLQVESILDKYKKILKKKYIHQTSITAAPSKQESYSKKTSKDHNKRQFKISDIHKLETPLPKSLIVDFVRNPRASADYVLTQVKETETVRNQLSAKPPPINNYTKQGCENQVFDDIRSAKLLGNVVLKETEVESEPYRPAQQTVNHRNDDHCYYEDDNTSPGAVSLPARTPELKIVDQSMFDPKTLLKSLSKDTNDNEIIPPPQEFCDDDISYSPIKAEYDVIAQGYYRDALTVATQKTDYIYHSLKENTNDLNNSHSSLTPSQEKETWTLSKEDEGEFRLWTEYQLESC